MRIYRFGGMMFLVTLMLLVAGQLALASEFTADVVETAMGQTIRGKVFVKGSNVYQETTVGKQKQISIFNAQKKVVWIIDPAKKTYISMPIPAAQLTAAVEQMRGKVPKNLTQQGMKVKSAGTEKVNGYVCEKTVIEGKGVKGTVWYSKKLDFAVKSEMTRTMGKQTIATKQEFKNIKEKKVADSFFQPPAGYKEVKHPNSQMQGGRSGPRRGAQPGRPGARTPAPRRAR